MCLSLGSDAIAKFCVRTYSRGARRLRRDTGIEYMKSSAPPSGEKLCHVADWSLFLGVLRSLIVSASSTRACCFLLLRPFRCGWVRRLIEQRIVFPLSLSLCLERSGFLRPRERNGRSGLVFVLV